MTKQHEYHPQSNPVSRNLPERIEHDMPFLSLRHGQITPHVRRKVVALQNGIGRWGWVVEPGYQEVVIENIKRNLHIALLEARAPELVTHLHHRENPFLKDLVNTEQHHAEDIRFAVLHDEAEKAINLFAEKLRAATINARSAMLWAEDLWDDLTPFDFHMIDPASVLTGMAIGITTNNVTYRAHATNTDLGLEKTFKAGHHRLNASMRYELYTGYDNKVALVNLGGGVVTIRNQNENATYTLQPGKAYIASSPAQSQVILNASFRAHSTDATLRRLTVMDGQTPLDLVPAFDPATNDYNVTADADADINLSYQLNDTRASATLTTAKDINTITVTAEDGTQNTYLVTVTRREAPPTNNEQSEETE